MHVHVFAMEGAQEQLKQISLESAVKNRQVGFNCEFVDRPPKAVQADCPICLLVLREPHQVTCCGYAFCRACIERIKTDKKSCPTCKKTDFSVFPDLRLQRSLYEFRVWCPYKTEGCEWSGELSQLEKHLNESPKLGEQVLGSHCTLQVINCDFQYAGCEAQLPRKDLPAHLAENLVTHMTLMAAHSQQRAAEKDKQIADLKLETQLLKSALAERESEIARLNAKQEEDRLQLETLQVYAGLPIELVLTEFEKYKENSDPWCSKPFYTHSNGYKLCLRVDANGHGDGKGTHISVTMYLMRGEFDDQLRWPFQGAVYFQLLNQLQDSSHFADVFDFGIATGPHINRVTAGAAASMGYGESSFLPHSELGRNRALNHQFLKDDCLCFRVTSATNVGLAQMSLFEKQCHAIESHVCMPPVEFTMRDFEELKANNLDWYSPSFYTHPRGYRMCLRVFANGSNSARGMHVTVYFYLMRGEWDNYLKWPFCGDITVHLLNQIEDKGHFEHIEHVGDDKPDQCTGRVTTEEKADGWACFRFIPLDELKYDRAKNCQYLKYDSLCFRVAKVEVSS